MRLNATIKQSDHGNNASIIPEGEGYLLIPAANDVGARSDPRCLKKKSKLKIIPANVFHRAPLFGSLRGRALDFFSIAS